MTQFGSDDFMAQLTDPSPDYDTLYPTVDALIRPFVCRHLNGHPELWDDLLQDIHLTVWQNFPAFAEQAHRYTPRQRRSWLYTIASNKANDTLRALSRPTGQHAQLPETLQDPSGDPEIRLLQTAGEEELSRRVDDLLHKACSLRSRPENTMAFLYNRVVMPLETEHVKKGDNKTVQMRLNGQPLGEIRKQLEQDLNLALGRELSPHILAPLDKAMQGQEARLFELTPRQIATASYSVTNSLSSAYERDFVSVPKEAAHGLTKNSLFFDNPWAASFYPVKAGRRRIQ